MKKVFLFSIMCLMAIAMNAQRCAVVGFKAGAKVSLSDIDGISETFSTYFRPQGYTMVDRLYIDKALAEQRIQRSSITEDLAVSAGKYMNVSKVVVGKVYISFDGGYQVDVTVLDVQSGLSVANDGTTVTPGNYRQNIQTLAKRLAGKIAIAPGQTVNPAPVVNNSRQRSQVEVLYGYLKIFPVELGVFEDEPKSVIKQINAQAQHGYNNWRIPTNEELSLMRANNYLGAGSYLSRENKKGIVLLVTDGKDYTTIQAEEKKAEEEARQREAERIAKSFVDLGLPSGTLWKDENEYNSNDSHGFYSYYEAKSKFGNKLPTKEQFEELKNKCQWSWLGNGYRITGPNGNSIFLPAAGSRTYDNKSVFGVGSTGNYWSSMDSNGDVRTLDFGANGVGFCNYILTVGESVRLVQNP